MHATRWIAGLVAIAVPAIAAAGPCDAVDSHVATVQAQLDRDAHAGRIHTWAWGLGNGAVAVGLLGLGLAASDPGTRAEDYVGAGGSALAALAPVLLQPVRAIDDARALRGLRAAAHDDAARCALGGDADRLLADAAADERAARGFWSHAVNVAVNGAGALVLGFGWHRWLGGGLGALAGIATGELQIYTRPTGAMRRWAVSPMLVPGATGFAVVGHF